MGEEDSGKSLEQFYSQYKQKIQQRLDPGGESNPDEKVISSEYGEFKDQFIPKHLSFYEKACNMSEKVFRIKPDKKKFQELEESLHICHLGVTPVGVTSFSVLFPIMFIFIGSIVSFLITALLTGSGSLFFVFFFLLAGFIMIIPLGNLPFFIANSWRLKASNQMVLCVFYVVSYMRHTSNLELAIKFTSDHLAPPLSLDLKRVLWSIETEKYGTIREALEDYMASWRKWNLEFIEAMHLIEASLYESSEDRRIQSLERGLSLILQETYEKMLHFAHDLQSPITMVHMLGIILPILSLVILPLVVSFMENVYWYHIAMIYNVALPVSVYYLSRMILSKRPTGYGQTNIMENSSEYKTMQRMYINKNISLPAITVAFIIGGLMLFLGFLPILIHMVDPSPDKGFDIIINDENKFQIVRSFEERQFPKYKFLGYRLNKKGTALIGPFGLGASILSLFVPLGLSVGMGMYHYVRTHKLMALRKNSKQLEAEFAAALFQLGSRVGDGIPAEIAFEQVADLMKDTYAGSFFMLLSSNISKLGMGVEQAMFDKDYGALKSYPSNLIRSSMEVFLESSKKGPQVASQALINISLYIKEMHNVDERLIDLLAETISSMKAQISMLTPLISGIVIGITAMITSILTKLGDQIIDLSKDTAIGGSGGMGTDLLQIFGDSLPTYYFQMIVGIYVVQITCILTIMVNSVQNGVDSLNERYMLGKNLLKSVTLYAFISLIVMIFFTMVSANVIGGMRLV